MKQNSNKNRSNGRHGRFNNNRRPSNNYITRNTVFDSTSPAGRIRGTSQQLMEKYLSLAKDAKNQDDRVMYETYSQYADHYTRMLEMAIANDQPKIQPQQQSNIEVSEEPTACVVPEEKDIPGPEAAAEPEPAEAKAEAEVQEKEDEKEARKKPRGRRPRPAPVEIVPIECAPTVKPTNTEE